MSGLNSNTTDGSIFNAIQQPLIQHFAIKSPAEATAYLDHSFPGPRLRECVDALLRVTDRTAHEIFGSPDDLKLKSSMTLFAHVSPKGSASEE